MHITRRQALGGIAAVTAAWTTPAWPHFDHDAASKGAQATPPRPLATSAAVDGLGRLWTAYVEPVQDGGAQRNANIVLAWSADLGRTWARSGPVLRTPEPVEANGEGRPKLAFGPAGQVYLSYTTPLARPHTGDFRFVRSTDGGVSFSEPVTVQRDRAVTGHRFDSLLVDRKGRVFIAWIDKRDGDAAKAAGAAYRGAALYYSVSSDDGATFLPDTKVADHCCECCRIALAIDTNGEVMAMWRHIFAPNVRDHAVAMLGADGRPGRVERASFDDWRIDACPHHGPGLAFDGKGRRHQVWFSAGNDGGGMFYSVARRRGQPGKAVRIGGVRAEHADVAATGQFVALVWKEFDGHQTRITARTSGDGGQRWREQSLASTAGGSDHPHLVTEGGDILLVWHTELDAMVVRKLESGP